MEDDDLPVFGEQDVDLDEVGFVKGSLNTLECVLGEKTRVATMSDDLWLGLEDKFEIHLIIAQILNIWTLSNYS